MIAFLLLSCLLSFSLSSPLPPQQIQHQIQQQPVNVLFLPLDERFTTRDAFLNLAKLTPFNINTPAPQYISYWRTPANLTYIYNWVEENLENVSFLSFSLILFSFLSLMSTLFGENLLR